MFELGILIVIALAVGAVILTCVVAGFFFEVILELVMLPFTLLGWLLVPIGLVLLLVGCLLVAPVAIAIFSVVVTVLAVLAVPVAILGVVACGAFGLLALV